MQQTFWTDDVPAAVPACTLNESDSEVEITTVSVDHVTTCAKPVPVGSTPSVEHKNSKTSSSPTPHHESTSQKRARSPTDSVNAIPKKPRKEKVSSAIRTALEKIKSQPVTKGLLTFFKPSTRQEHETHIIREAEKEREKKEEKVWQSRQDREVTKVEVREDAKLRKRKESARKKEEDIHAGLRSPGGTKRKVNLLSY